MIDDWDKFLSLSLSLSLSIVTVYCGLLKIITINHNSEIYCSLACDLVYQSHIIYTPLPHSSYKKYLTIILSCYRFIESCITNVRYIQHSASMCLNHHNVPPNGHEIVLSALQIFSSWLTYWGSVRIKATSK